LIRRFFNGPATPIKDIDVKEKVIVITGCSAGVGKETAKELLRNGAKVVFACRDEAKTMNIINSLPEESQKRATFIKIDLSSFESVKTFVKVFSEKFDKVDILVANAGIVNTDFFVSKDNLEMTFQSNFLAHMYLTALMLKYLSKNGRVLHVGSDAHTFVKSAVDPKLIEDLAYAKENFGWWKFYSISKLANLYFTSSLARYFEKEGTSFKTVCIHPGAVNSELGRPSNFLMKIARRIAQPFLQLFGKDELMGAQTTLHCCYLNDKSLVNGGYYFNCKLGKATKLALEDEERAKFMKSCSKVLKEKINEYPSELVGILNI